MAIHNYAWPTRMHYELPPGARSAQDLKFPDAVRIPKNPTGVQGRMIPSGDPANPATLGFRVKKWGNGASSSHTQRRYYQGSFGTVAKTAGIRKK